MKITETQLKKIIKEIVQVPKPHKVEEEVTEEMLEDMISVLPLWEIGEFDQVEALIQDLHPMGRTQLHNLMNAAEEMKNYGQINDNVPEFATDYFHKKFVDEWEEIQEMKTTRRQLRKIIKESIHSQLDGELTNLVFLAAQEVDREYGEITVQDVVDEIKRMDSEGQIYHDDPKFQDYFVSLARELTYEDVVDRMQELTRMGELNDDLEDFYSMGKMQ